MKLEETIDRQIKIPLLHNMENLSRNKVSYKLINKVNFQLRTKVYELTLDVEGKVYDLVRK